MADAQGGVAWRWSESRQAAVAFLVAFAALAFLPAAKSIAGIFETDAEPLHELGKAAALAGFSLLALQCILSSRIKVLERPFGLDRLVRFHKAMGLCAVVLLLSHPVLMAAEDGNWGMLWVGAGTPIALGKLALALLSLVVLTALLYKRVGLDYQTWRFMHKGAPVVVAVGLTHAMRVSENVRPTSALGIYMMAMIATALGLFVYRNLIVPLWGRRTYTVQKVEQASHNTWTLTFAPEGEPMPLHRPGQFLFLTLRRAGLRAEEHPFTISSSPTSAPEITVTIKESGDYTRTIGRTQPGDTALLDGPYGRFSLVHHDAPAYLFIAGGVGITPIMSMLRYMRDSGDGRPARLIFANRRERDILFRDELAAMPGNVGVVHVLSEAGEEWKGCRGRASTEVIRDLAGDLMTRADVFLCGPPPMMEALSEALRECGVAKRRIHMEKFAL